MLIFSRVEPQTLPRLAALPRARSCRDAFRRERGSQALATLATSEPHAIVRIVRALLVRMNLLAPSEAEPAWIIAVLGPDRRPLAVARARA